MDGSLRFFRLRPTKRTFPSSFVRHARQVSCAVDRRRAVDVVDEVLQSCRCPTPPLGTTWVWVCLGESENEGVTLLLPPLLRFPWERDRVPRGTSSLSHARWIRAHRTWYLFDLPVPLARRGVPRSSPAFPCDAQVRLPHPLLASPLSSRLGKDRDRQRQRQKGRDPSVFLRWGGRPTHTHPQTHPERHPERDRERKRGRERERPCGHETPTSHPLRHGLAHLPRPQTHRMQTRRWVTCTREERGMPTVEGAKRKRDGKRDGDGWERTVG